MEEARIKESFSKIKEDILYLQQEITVLKQEIKEIKQILQSSTYPTQDRHSTHFPAHNLQNYCLNRQNFQSSIGNKGVPADRQQIDSRQTDTLKRTSEITSKIPLRFQESPYFLPNLIDNLRKDLGEKFQKLTRKEFLIFSTLYTLEEEKGNVTYSNIAQRTGLTESSIRDYIARLTHKGIPVIKEKLNNKVVVLKIPRELKDLATLDKLSKLKGF